jgi:dihydrolipoamide dehydrogenase
MEKGTEGSYDLLIVGGGPGGYVAAIRAAQLGLRTALVEKERPGGVCLNWGCIPTKAMLRSAEVLETMQHSSEYGVLADNVRLDYAAVLQRKDRIVKGLTDGVAGLLKTNGVTVVSGHARFTGPTSVEVVAVGEAPLGAGGPLYNAPATDSPVQAELRATDVIIATGSTPAQLPIPGNDLPGVVNSDGAFMLTAVPRRVLVCGGSAVGAEWASMLSAFGSEVIIVELMPSLVPSEDTDIGQALGRSFSKRGIKVVTGSSVSAIEPVDATDSSSALRVAITDAEGTQKQTAEAELVVIGVGRQPNLVGLQLERTGVATDSRGFITVDDGMHTNVPHVYAIGDVTGRVLLAHVASHQGLVAAAGVAGRDERMDYKAVPAATFTHPEVASVGLTERRAREQGFDVVIGRFPFAALGRAQTYGATEGMIKVVADRQYGELLGLHIIGPSATDLITEGVLALNLEATLHEIAGSIHAHPTLGEGSMEACMVALGLPMHAPPGRPTKGAVNAGTRVRGAAR